MVAKVTFYTRSGCHLCEDMLHHLLELQENSPFEIESIDIDQDEGLKIKYGTLIPVLAVGEKVLCNYYLDLVALGNYLDSV